MLRVAGELAVELVGTHRDLVEVAALAEVNTHRHHVDLETLELLIRDVGAGIDDYRDTAPMTMMRSVLLLAHVVGLLARDLAELTRQAKHSPGVIDMHMHLG